MNTRCALVLRVLLRALCSCLAGIKSNFSCVLVETAVAVTCSSLPESNHTLLLVDRAVAVPAQTVGWDFTLSQLRLFGRAGGTRQERRASCPEPFAAWSLRTSVPLAASGRGAELHVRSEWTQHFSQINNSHLALISPNVPVLASANFHWFCKQGQIPGSSPPLKKIHF